MKKLFFVLSCVFLFSNCNKDLPATELQSDESSDQKLSKIVNTYIIDNVLFASDSMEFTYDNAGKIINEGSIHYDRDNLERIVKITKQEPGSTTFDSYVYYSDSQTGKVDYVIFKIPDFSGDIIDSTVYLHDNSGRLFKTMEYAFFEDLNSYELVSYYNLDYDEAGNVRRATRYALNDKNLILCSTDQYTYDSKTNPLHTNDEVRILTQLWHDLNTSSNNIKTMGGKYSKQYEYRNDGRPRVCSIREYGTKTIDRIYYYK